MMVVVVAVMTLQQIVITIHDESNVKVNDGDNDYVNDGDNIDDDDKDLEAWLDDIISKLLLNNNNNLLSNIQDYLLSIQTIQFLPRWGGCPREVFIRQESRLTALESWLQLQLGIL